MGGGEHDSTAGFRRWLVVPGFAPSATVTGTLDTDPLADGGPVRRIEVAQFRMDMHKLFLRRIGTQTL